MGLAKDIGSRLAAYAIWQVIVIALGGAGAVTTLVGAAADVHPGWLVGFGVSSFLFFFGAASLYRRQHPKPPEPMDEALRERRRERIETWRARIANRTRFPIEAAQMDVSPLREAGFYVEMKAYLPDEIGEQFEEGVGNRPHFAKGGDPMAALLLEEIARLEREWGLV